MIPEGGYYGCKFLVCYCKRDRLRWRYGMSRLRVIHERDEHERV
jgi:hypothetical protein